MNARIAEIFESIQGEGLFLGQRQIFVRFFGCQLHCSFCDTPLSTYKEYDVAQLMDEVKKLSAKTKVISLTGGEPLTQYQFLREFMKVSHTQGFTNYLETNGVLCDELVEVIGTTDVVAMDFKFPSSTGQGAKWEQHRKFLAIASECEVVFAKAVICGSTDMRDLEQAVEIIKEIDGAITLILQPNSQEEPERLRGKLLEYKDYCQHNGIVTVVIPQMQKLIGIR